MITSRKNKAFALLLSLMTILSVFSVSGAVTASADFTVETNLKPTTFYFKPNSNWLKDNAIFEMYLRGNGSDYKAIMTDLGNGYYSAEAPKGYANSHVQFNRLNPEDTSQVWNNTGRLEIPIFGGNCYTLKLNDWSGLGGLWSNYETDHESQTVYFKPNKNWLRGGARFAIYLSDGKTKNTWISMTDSGNGYYSAKLPEKEYLQLTFMRMNPASEENNWSTYCNKSSTHNIYTMSSVCSDGTNYFVMDENKWNSATGVWYQTPKSTLYLKPNDNWIMADARFAMYLYGGKSEPVWVSMTENSFNEGYYSAQIPNGDYSNVIFARMNPASEENCWANLWNRTERLSFPQTNENIFTVADNVWSSASGEWSEIKFNTIYLKPDDMWLENCGATIVRDYDSGKELTMVHIGDGYFKCELPPGEFEKLEFVGITDKLVENPYGAGTGFPYVEFKALYYLETDVSNCYVLEYRMGNYGDCRYIAKRASIREY